MELHIASLTAIERTKWADAHKTYFSEGINKESIQTIEKAMFLVSKQLISPFGGYFVEILILCIRQSEVFYGNMRLGLK